MIINCDGAARGNPGPAGAGAVVVDEDGVVLAEVAEGLGETTNNVAEYTAVVRGLEEAQRLGAARGAPPLRQPAADQSAHRPLQGEGAAPAAAARRVRELLRTFERADLEHVPRERNAAADALANLGVDRWLADGRP